MICGTAQNPGLRVTMGTIGKETMGAHAHLNTSD